MRRNALRTIASLGPWLAPVLSAFFIGRSIYLHLLLQWQVEVVQVLPAINLAVAIIAGASIEVLAIVSIHNCLALYRWNDQGRVQREKGGWEAAPLRLALACAGTYVVTAILLLVVLEALPWLAQYAPILFPLLAVVGAINLVLLNQHGDRLERYELNWDLSKKRPGATRKRPDATASDSQATASDQAATEQATLSDSAATDAWLTCDRCEWKRLACEYESEDAARNALNAHHGWHTRRERGRQE